MEWLKDILGEAYSEDIAVKINEKLKSEYAPRVELDTALQEKATAEQLLDEAAKGEDWKAKFEELQKSIAAPGEQPLQPPGAEQGTASADDWQAKYEALQQSSAAELADLRFSGVFSEAIKRCGGRSGTSIRAELGEEKYKSLMSAEQPLDAVIEALNGLKAQENTAFLFDETPEFSVTSGGAGTDTTSKAGLRESIAAAIYGQK